MNFKPGMYVRCNIDEDYQEGREFLLGQIASINLNTSQLDIVFHDIQDKNIYFDHIPGRARYYPEEVEHCKIMRGSLVKYKDLDDAKIVQHIGQDEEGFHSYYIKTITGEIKILQASEKEITVQYDDGDYQPLKQLINYEFQNPVWYKNRSLVASYMNTIRNAPYGFELLLGSRVYLLPHQIDTIVRGISKDKCRLMLADEVGLGKTIEACVILKGLQERKYKFRTLIIVPESLIVQWQNELFYKFWLDVPIWGQEESSLSETTILISTENLLREENKNLLNVDWDLCIVDETHRLLKDEERYQRILELSKKTDNILLLSATPIQRRRTEYLSLLRLLHPDTYKSMSENRFEQILEKGKYIKDIVHELVMDLNYFIEDEMGYEYRETFRQINEELEDQVLDKLISMMDLDSEDQGLEIAKIILAYISNNYEVEKDIIRNRRIELADQMATRTCEPFYYSMSGSEANFYELDTYNSLIDYLDMVQRENLDKLPLVSRYKKVFLSAMLSSPWAIYNLLEFRYSYIKGLAINKKLDKGYKNLLKSVPSFDKEGELLQTILFYCNNWMEESEGEFEQIEHLHANPHLIKGRLMHAADYLCENCYDEKIVIFTQWTETAVKFEEILREKFSENAVASFYKGKTLEELELSVDKFQSKEDCRFLICDQLGGEGRNFQLADGILHLDLPWSPVELEQRIGRLDRIGRNVNKEVLSIVFMAEQTIEEDLFALWNKGLNIFQESLSGIEIALGDVEKEIFQALSTDSKYGLRNSVEKVIASSVDMRREVEKERYFDYAKRLDPRREAKLAELIDKFDREGGRALYESMNAWGSMVGYTSNNIPIKRDDDDNVDFISVYRPSNFKVNAANNALYYPPDTTEALKRRKNPQELAGTFSRDLAVKREELIFFAPGEKVFESIVENALKSYKGRCCALAIPADFNWLGIIYTWYMDLNITYLIENGISINKKDKIYEFLPANEIRTVHPLTKTSLDIDKNLVLQELDHWRIVEGVGIGGADHLGRRGPRRGFLQVSNKYDSNLDWFKAQFDPESWIRLVEMTYKDSLETTKNQFRKQIDVDGIRQYYEDEVISNTASNIYYSNGEISLMENQELIKEKNSIIKGLEDMKLNLDSAIFVWLVNKE